MKIRGIEVSSATIGRIAHENDIRHSDACRDANPRGGGGGRVYRCCCDFFEQVAEHVEAPLANAVTAQDEAESLFAVGYKQISRKYARVARLVSGSWEDGREVSEAVLVQLRRLHRTAFDKHVVDRLVHFKTVMDLVPGDACEYRLADYRLGRDHTPTTDWLPGSVVESGRLGTWKIAQAGSDALARARPENIRLRNTSEACGRSREEH